MSIHPSAPDIFARALLDKDTSPASSSLASSTSQTQADNNVPLVDHLIQRRDLLDVRHANHRFSTHADDFRDLQDSNAAKELMEGQFKIDRSTSGLSQLKES